MESYQENSNIFQEGQLSNNEVNNIYQLLSSPATFEDIDTNDELNFINSCIDKIYDEKFKLIESTELLKNTMLLNNKFVELIKYCKQNHKYKKVGYIFIGFCYYFDIDECIVYKNLHEKLQMLIKQAAIRMCGRNIFKKNLENSQKNKDIQITTLFSIAGK